MSFSNLIRKRNHLEFDIDNVDLSIINSIRRIILSEIENIAIEFSPIGSDKVEIKTNTGPLHNEFLLHRLSLVPICLTPNEIINFKSDDYTFLLKKKNTTNSIIDVTTNDIQILDSEGKEILGKKKEEIFPKNPITQDYVLITKLKPNLFDITDGNEIDIKMNAVKNIGKKYSGFSVVSKCSFYNIVDETKAKKVFIDLKKSNTKYLIEDFNNLEKQKCFYTNRLNEPNKIKFQLKSECLLKPEYIFIKGFLVLEKRLENFKKKILDDDYEFNYTKENEIYEFIIKDEDHTTGNLLQDQFYNKFIIEDNKEVLKFIGYNMLHPLDASLIIKLQFTKELELDNIKEFIKNGINLIEDKLNLLIKEWFAISKLDNDYALDLENL
jgi:DNA-directed RNA polymerase subunit L